MVDWKSPDEFARESLAFDRLMHSLFGLYLWEWLISLDFDWEFITLQRRFHWPMIFYFLSRYCMLFSLIGIIIGLDVTSPIDCQPLYSFNTIVGASAIGLASVNLSLRTMAVWSGRWYIVVPLVIIILGHFALLMHSVVTLTARWITGQGCVIIYTNNDLLSASFIYTMTFDFIILLLTAVKLFKSTTTSDSRLKKLIFTDGLIYFIIAVLSNALVTAFILLDFNPIMSVITNIPAAVLSTIAACRVIRRLKNYTPPGFTSFSMHTQFSSVVFRSYEQCTDAAARVIQNRIHIQTDSETPPNSVSESKFTNLKFEVDRDPEFFAIQRQVSGRPQGSSTPHRI